jgi:hypothetical protein
LSAVPGIALDCTPACTPVAKEMPWIISYSMCGGQYRIAAATNESCGPAPFPVVAGLSGYPATLVGRRKQG